ncbi:LamG-like jellyroll fold domain-containing protein [Krasilnikovia sp. M28-CT-15]|uniref:LamG-like jellyroll fold domain-containing protein n=1 Tax=Krasilnikovia sp. M28-CT-15 TaxID=3373540 RepID=UPI00399D3CA8
MITAAPAVPTLMVAQPAHAAEAACAAEAGSEAAAESMAQRCDQSVEVVDARTELTRTFVEASGARKLEAAVTPQRVHRADGSWVPVSTMLTPHGDGFAATASTADITFSGGGTAPLVTWRSGGSTFTLSWLGPEAGATPGTGRPDPSGLPAPRLDKDSAVYDEVLPGVALYVTATADGFRHALEVKSAAAAANPALRSIRYAVGGTATRRTNADGVFEVVDAAGEVFATGGGAAMWDSTTPAAASSVAPMSEAGRSRVTAMRAQAAADPDGDLQSTAARPGAAAVTHTAGVTVSDDRLTVVPDAAMLTSPATVFPVFIDPPMNGKRTKWAWANSGNFDTDVENRARVGRNPYDDVRYRSYFNFDIEKLNDSRILDAKITMVLDHSWSCDPTWVWLYRTGAITVDSGKRMNWSTRPLPGYTLGSRAANANEAGGCGTIQPDANVEFDTEALRADLEYAASPQHHWGIYVAALCACNDSGEYETSQDRWKKFYTDKTYLIVKYDKPPNAPVPQPFNPTTECYKACSGTATVRTSTPTLVARASDPFDGNLKTTFEVRTAASASASLVASNASAPFVGAADSNAKWPVSASLADGTYYWRAQSKDENNLVGAWSGWQTLKVDRTAPATPTISSAQFPFKQWGAQLGQQGTFTFDSGGDAAEYTWAVDGGSTTTTTSASASYRPVTDMVHTMQVYATDVAGNKSTVQAQNGYQFWVTPLPNRCWNWRLDETSGSTAADKGNTDSNDSVCAPLENPPAGVSAQAQPGTLSGGVTWGSGYVGNAATFSGSGQITTAGPVLDTSKSFTVMAWVRPTSLGSAQEQTVLSQDGNTTSRFALMFRRQANNGAGGWCFGLRDADAAGTGPTVVCATGQIGDNTRPADNQWVHLGGVYNAETSTLQLHVMGNQDSCNGEMASAAATGTGWAGAGSLVIGRGKADGGPASYWRGSVDQVYAHQRALKPYEICQQAGQ